jgi:hypothetical protein
LPATATLERFHGTFEFAQGSLRRGSLQFSLRLSIVDDDANDGTGLSQLQIAYC